MMNQAAPAARTTETTLPHVLTSHHSLSRLLEPGDALVTQ